MGNPNNPNKAGAATPVWQVGMSGTPTGADINHITAGGTAEIAFAAETITRTAWLKNPDAETLPLFYDISGIDAGTVEVGTCFSLPPGATVVFGQLTTHVSVNAVTTGHKIAGLKS